MDSEEKALQEGERKVTVEDVRKYLLWLDLGDTVMFENPDFAGAFIGTDSDGRAVYDFELMVRCLMEEDGMSDDEAREFIDYNTLRAIPYMGEMAPVVVYPFCRGIA